MEAGRIHIPEGQGHIPAQCDGGGDEEKSRQLGIVSDGFAWYRSSVLQASGGREEPAPGPAGTRSDLETS